ncbi:hypothetical protein [Vibrio parahaemolyticus]|uniref:hypothetical protein n=1 Tax=Vibrio parahaemolyticus TaxID=670 RepID=UPI001E2AC36B|nr:hypothetical protein [Vibrio parahaemolyticus]
MIEYLDRPIAFHRSFVKMGIGITGALMLSQSIYWSRRTNASGWFYKTQEEWQDETGMTRRELDTARKKLRQLGILEEKKQGVPCRVFYRINEPNLIAQMEQTGLAECAKLERTNAPSSAVPISQTKTETTQRLPETTTEKVNKKSPITGSLVPEEQIPAMLDHDAWAEYLAFRKRIKKPFKTERGERTKMLDLLKLSQSVVSMQRQIIEQSIDNEWQGLFSLKSPSPNSKLIPVEQFSDQTNPDDYGPPQWFKDRQNGGDQ